MSESEPTLSSGTHGHNDAECEHASSSGELSTMPEFPPNVISELMESFKIEKKYQKELDLKVNMASAEYKASRGLEGCDACRLRCLMKVKYNRLLEGNRLFSQIRKAQDPEFFQKLAFGTQKPDYLWIGCADSRVPANELTKTGTSAIFVHRNIANVVIPTDVNLMSVLHFALDYWQVSHIIVCGHYGCAGIEAAMSRKDYGTINSWLHSIKSVALEHYDELSKLRDFRERWNRLVEINVVAQVHNLAKTKVVQNAWRTRMVQLHGWVYGLNDGLITDLQVDVDTLHLVPPSFRFTPSRL
eukprot:gb/GEZN01008978.1/.p1 GENE.gb/GEZN01008978.1/~~gb/GEZN01008978.1/.p1  ORF type:complete len:300 (+),score=31.15 gb/GEZN01008978.1/:135-1034(+)